MKEKWDKVKEMNEKINNEIKNPDMLDRLQTPCSSFVTFETEEGFQRAKMYNQLVEESKENLALIKKAKKNKKKADNLIEN